MSRWYPEAMFDNVKQEQKEVLKEQGKAEFLKLEEGVTVLTVDTTVEIRDKTGDFGKQKIIRVTKNKEPYDLPASLSLAKQIFATMAKEKTDKIQIIRAGTGKQTRYSVKKA